MDNGFKIISKNGGNDREDVLSEYGHMILTKWRWEFKKNGGYFPPAKRMKFVDMMKRAGYNDEQINKVMNGR